MQPGLPRGQDLDSEPPSGTHLCPLWGSTFLKALCYLLNFFIILCLSTDRVSLAWHRLNTIARQSGRADYIICRTQNKIKMQGPSQGSQGSQGSQSPLPTCPLPQPRAVSGLQGITISMLGHTRCGCMVHERPLPSGQPHVL